MKATIIQVFPEPRMWGDKYPDACSVGGLFTDGAKWEVNTKTNKAKEHIEALQKLQGQKCEFEAEEGKPYQGQRQFIIKNYPGRPGGEGGGKGGGRFETSWRNTREGSVFEAQVRAYSEERSDRRTAIMQAVQLTGEGDATVALHYASEIYDWLRQSEQAVLPTSVGLPERETPKPEPVRGVANAVQQHMQQRGQSHPILNPTEAPSMSGSASQASGGGVAEVWEGPGQCPRCHAPQGKRHGKPCTSDSTERDDNDPFADD